MVRPRPLSLRRIYTHPAYFLACGFGAGAAPFAPGTFGTLVAVPLYWLAHTLPLAGYLLLCAALFAIGVGVCHIAERDLGVHDHPGIVWDEITGYFVTMIAAPRGWPWMIAGFAAFRLFDILKPWPIRQVDRRVAGGLGIMLDDLLAGVYAALVLWLATRVLGKF